MKYSVQTENLEMLEKAVRSDCEVIRFGSEFCEWKIPSLDRLKEAYALIKGKGKEFTYVTPRVSTGALEKLRGHLAFLDGEGEIIVVINDLGMLNVLDSYPNLMPHLGRQLVTIPARSLWKEILPIPRKFGFFARRNVARIFYQTSLNYTPTIQLFQKYRVEGADVDWIPQCFKHYPFLVRGGLKLSVHMHLVPVTITRKCHTARFVGEETPENCSRPCDRGSFLLKHEILKHDILGGELFLHGNVVFRLVQPSRGHVKKLHRSNVTELIISMNPITEMESHERINELIESLQP